MYTEAAQLARFKSQVLPIPKIINNSDKQVTCSYKGMLNHQEHREPSKTHSSSCLHITRGSTPRWHQSPFYLLQWTFQNWMSQQCFWNQTAMHGFGEEGGRGGGKGEGSLAGQKYCLSLNCHSTTINLLPLMFQLWNVHHRARAKLMNCNIILSYTYGGIPPMASYTSGAQIWPNYQDYRHTLMFKRTKEIEIHVFGTRLAHLDLLSARNCRKKCAM